MEVYLAHKKLIQKMSWAAKFESCCMGKCQNLAKPTLSWQGSVTKPFNQI